MHPCIDVRVTSQERIRQLGFMRNDLDDVRREIASVIERVELVRGDLYGERNSTRSTFLSIWWCCRRRDLRNLEDRLWLRLYQLQEKENELHRQRTALLFLSLRSDSRGESPAVARQPSPVSPEEAPESPPWQQRPLRPERRQPALIASIQARSTADRPTLVLLIRSIPIEQYHMRRKFGSLCEYKQRDQQMWHINRRAFAGDLVDRDLRKTPDQAQNNAALFCYH